MSTLRGIFWKTRFSVKGDVLDQVAELRRMQYSDSEQMQRTKEQRLKQLLLHAYHHVPYYSDVLKSCGVIDGKESVNLQRFNQIPFLDKSIIRFHYDALKSDDLPARQWYENTSGGSTGEPVRFIQDQDYYDSSRAKKILFDQWTGYNLGERKVLLWGSERDLFVGRDTLQDRFVRWLKNEQWLNAFRITPEQMYAYVKVINDFKPVQILAYVASIYELSCFIEREGISVASPKSIMVSAGVLYPQMRETIERVFRAPVFDRYGSREVGDIACESKCHKGLHVSTLTHHVEVLRNDGTPAEPGEFGEIVITLLTNYAMPLIRYRIGDIGRWSNESCACGISWPLLKNVSGKTWDIFRTKDGTQAHGELFIRIFYFQDWIRKFQVIQEELDFIRVLIVPNADPIEVRGSYEREINEISAKIKFVMGQDCSVEFDFVDEIEPTASGKYYYIISRVGVEDRVPPRGTQR